MATAITTSTLPPLPLYPFAAAPDIVRSNQKDTHTVTTLTSTLTDLLRRLYGSRFTHTFSPEISTLTHLLYLSLTTLAGNRTLGEEYTSIYQIDNASSGDGNSKARSQPLPAIGKRASYILLAVILPYAVAKTLPLLRRQIRDLLDVQKQHQQQNLNAASPSSTSTLSALPTRLLKTLYSLTSSQSTAQLQILTLTLFYLKGSHYHLSKQLVGLRYIFGKRLTAREEQARVGYEVLGVLLVVQMAVQCGLQVAGWWVGGMIPGDNNDGGNDNNIMGNVGNAATVINDDSKARIAAMTHTPLFTLPLSSSSKPADTDKDADTTPRYNLASPTTMSWMQPTQQQQRKCTLCLELMRDPSVTTCGHVFCWSCILDWVKEKAECPLCRRGVLGQHVLPLRG